MKGKEELLSDLKNRIRNKIKERGVSALSSILSEFREEYLHEIKKFGIKDPEQSWKPFKGRLLEDIIRDTIFEIVTEKGFSVIKGNLLNKEDKHLGKELAKVKRNLVVDYGEFGMHLPDADLIIYEPKTCQPVAIISSKTTLRERIAQTGYWSLKLKQSEVTKDIKVIFVTLDEDGDLKVRNPAKKGRAIAEVDIDMTFVISEEKIEESEKVKSIDKFHEFFSALILSLKHQ